MDADCAKDEIHRLIYDKQAKTLIAVSGGGLINDIEGGAPFWPSLYVDNYYIQSIKGRE